MKALPIDPRSSDSPEALLAFFTECQSVARLKHRAQLVSISLPVDGLDPLAVLESIFEGSERHFYLERPAEDLAVAAAEAVVSFECEGVSRVAELQTFIDDTLANTLVVGDLSRPWSGPHFFVALTFSPCTEAGEAFRAGTLFVPRWQVGRRGGQTVAVANTLITPDADLRPLVERVWRARRKFGSFDYSGVVLDSPPVHAPSSVRDVGPPGHYEQAVSEAVRRIEAGEFAKIVLARAKDLVAERPLHPLRVLNELRERYPDCFAFSIANGRGQSFIGATPERLARVQAGVLETEALAGSCRRGQTASEDAALAAGLLRSEKDRSEHQMVLGSIERRLRTLGITLTNDESPRLRRLANVQHLHTPIRAALPPGTRLLQVVEALHPTPAVGGTPREAAVSRIRSLETCPRGLYAGAIGWIDGAGNGEFVVGLRSALIDGVQARLFAGAGIVAGSAPDRERAETELKFRAMEDALLGRG